MGDIRFDPAYARVREARHPQRVIRQLPDEAVIEALAGAVWGHDALLVNVLATEALNRMGRLSALHATLPEGLVATDTNGRVTYATPGAARITGLPPEVLLGRPIMDAVALLTETGELVPRDERPLMRALVEEREFTGRLRLVAADGKPRVVDYSAAPIRRDGIVVGGAVSFRDARESEAREAFLSESVDQWRRIVDAIPDAVVRVGRDGRIRYASPSIRLVTDHDVRELLGRAALDFTHPDDKRRVRTAYEECRQQGHPRDVVFRAVQNDGRHQWVQARLLVLRGGHTEDAHEVMATMRAVPEGVVE